jgi:hypothetical protein
MLFKNEVTSKGRHVVHVVFTAKVALLLRLQQGVLFVMELYRDINNHHVVANVHVNYASRLGGNISLSHILFVGVSLLP